MKNMSKEKLIFIKKLVGVGSAVLCLLMMMFNFIDYTSTSSIATGGDITWSDSFSLFSFLFNGNKEVIDCNISVLRDVFTFSYVIVWISAVLCLASIIISLVGVFSKKNIFSKMGGYISIVSALILILITFNRYSAGNTIRYLDVFNWIYAIIIFVTILGTVCVVSIDEK